MTVWVDDMYRHPMGRFGRMKMSHLIADGGEAELLEFADRIGLARRWIQHAGQGRGRVHFDISMSMRRKAVEAGAVEITLRECGAMCREWNIENVARRKAGQELK